MTHVYQLPQGCWPNLKALQSEDNADLNFMDVYRVAQGVVIHKTIDCKYARLFASWLEEWGYAVKYYKDSDLSSSDKSNSHWLSMNLYWN